MAINAPLNRKLRMGLVGGGQGAFIGRVHSIAATLDNRAALVAGALSSDPARARASAPDYDIPADRAVKGTIDGVPFEHTPPSKAQADAKPSETSTPDVANVPARPTVTLIGGPAPDVVGSARPGGAPSGSLRTERAGDRRDAVAPPARPRHGGRNRPYSRPAGERSHRRDAVPRRSLREGPH